MKTVIGALLFVFSLSVAAVEGAHPLEEVDYDVFDQESVRRGAEFYVNYCQGCHSLKHLRYSRLAKDYGIAEEELEQKLLLGGRKAHESMTSAMRPEDAEAWFGAPPPDLSLAARASGPDWLYSYLKGFYRDPTRPSGVNNLYSNNILMPNVFAELQGMQEPVLGKRDGAPVIKRLQVAQPGTMTPAQFDQALTDLVSFLVYASEPAQLDRLRLGKYVLAFLLAFAYLLYRVKKEYWKDVH